MSTGNLSPEQEKHPRTKSERIYEKTDEWWDERAAGVKSQGSLS